MSSKLPEHGIRCVIVPRKTEGGRVISASDVRQAIKEGRLEEIRGLVPETTYEYFASDEGEKVIERIRGTENVIHY